MMLNYAATFRGEILFSQALLMLIFLEEIEENPEN